MLLDCLERRGVVVDLGVAVGVAAGGGGPARVCVEVGAAKLACNNITKRFSMVSSASNTSSSKFGMAD